jgi:hypothetical protein
LSPLPPWLDDLRRDATSNFGNTYFWSCRTLKKISQMQRENRNKNATPRELGPYAWPEHTLATEKVGGNAVLSIHSVVLVM